MSYTSGVDYDRLPGEAIFINSNLISTEPASVKEKDSGDKPTGQHRRRRRARAGKVPSPSVQDSREVWENFSCPFWKLEFKNGDWNLMIRLGI